MIRTHKTNDEMGIERGESFVRTLFSHTSAATTRRTSAPLPTPFTLAPVRVAGSVWSLTGANIERWDEIEWCTVTFDMIWWESEMEISFSFIHAERGSRLYEGIYFCVWGKFVFWEKGVLWRGEFELVSLLHFKRKLAIRWRNSWNRCRAWVEIINKVQLE